MTLSRRQVLELCEQFAALHDAELPIADLPGMNLDAAALQILEQRIREDREVRRLYVRYMRLCAALAWDMGGAQRGDESSREQPSACRIGAPLVSRKNFPLPPGPGDQSVPGDRTVMEQEARASSETAVQEELPAEPGVRPPPGNSLGFYNPGSTSVSAVNINGATIDIAVNDNNGYTTNFYLTGGTMSASGGGTFHFANGYGVTTYSSTATSVISSGIVTRDNGTMNFDVASGTTASGVDLLVSGNITALTFVGGVEGINKTGPGVMVLAGINTYTGGTTVNGGVLQLDAGGSTGAICGVLTINPGAAVKLNADNALGWSSGASWVTTVNVNGATIDFSGIGNNGYTTNFYLTGGTMSSTGGGPFHFSNGYGVTTYSSTATSVINSDIVVRDNGTMNFDVASGTTASGVDLLVSGNISPLTFIGGVEGINKTGSGVMVLSGNNSYDGGVEGINKTGSGVMVLSGNNSYDGGTTVNEGTLVVTSSTALPDGTSLTVGAGGTFVFDPSLSLGGAPVAASAAVTAVPEPGTLALLVVGLAGLLVAWRRRRAGSRIP